MKPRIAVPALVLAAAAAAAQVHDHAPAPVPAVPVPVLAVPATAAAAGGVEALSPELRQLLKLEMAGLQGAMLELVPAAAAGDWEAIAAIAARIRDGFVLARQLTPEQREELHRALPAGFLERDAEFHETATGLEHAAHRRQADLVPFYVYKLTEGCVGCHSRHARTRFPAFAPAPAPAAHAH